MGEMSDKIWTHNPNYPDCKEPPLSEKDKALNEIECLLEELLSKVEALKEPRPGGPLMKILNLMRSKFIPQGKVIVSDMDFPPAHPAEENDNITSAPFPVDMVEAEPEKNKRCTCDTQANDQWESDIKTTEDALSRILGEKAPERVSDAEISDLLRYLQLRDYDHEICKEDVTCLFSALQELQRRRAAE